MNQSNINKINFEPLNRNISYKDAWRGIRGNEGTYIGKFLNFSDLPASSAPFAVILGMLFVFLFTLALSNLIFMALFIIFVLGFIFALFQAVLGNYKKTTKLNEFALENNFKIKHKVDPYNQYEGLIFQHGDNRLIFDAIVFGDSNDIEIGNYQYETANNRNNSTYDYGYIKIKLNKKLPHMLLDAKSNNFAKIFSNLPGDFKSSQKFSLEGDFNKYFTLYAPIKYKKDALYIFTPDVMQTFVDSARDYDVEIVDDYLYIYSNNTFNLLSSNDIKELLNIAHALSKDLSKQARLYADQNISTKSGNISYHGQRLKKNKFPEIAGVLLFISVIIINILQLFPTYINNSLSIIFTITVIGLLFYSIFRR